MRNVLLLLLAFVALAAAWTKEDHDIFRLKDEIEQTEGTDATFYSYLGISPAASQEDIGKAVRKLAKQHHPDKAKQAFMAAHATSASASARSSYKSAISSAKAAGKPTSNIKPPKPSTRATKPPSDREIRAAIKRATERSARIGVVGEILKGPGRQHYDHFLKNGFPAWRGTGWYYERYRPGLGSVLTGLFIFAGGAVHYAVLTMSYNRRRKFVERYISQARTLAWGDSSALAGISGLGTFAAAAEPSSPPPAADAADEDSPAVQALNRRERRAQEKASKKPSAKNRKAATSQKDSGTSTPQNEPAAAASSDGAGGAVPAPGPRKRVLAENGKVLVVDSTGAVFLEETVKEDEDDSEDEGAPQLFLLDPDEEHRPSLRDTMVWRLPVWLVNTATRGVTGMVKSKDEQAEEAAAGDGQRRRKVPLKPKPGQFGGSTAEEVKIAVAEKVEKAEDEFEGFVNVASEEAQAVVGAVQNAGNGGAKKRKGKGKK